VWRRNCFAFADGLNDRDADAPFAALNTVRRSVVGLDPHTPGHAVMLVPARGEPTKALSRIAGNLRNTHAMLLTRFHEPVRLE